LQRNDVYQKDQMIHVRRPSESHANHVFNRQWTCGWFCVADDSAQSIRVAAYT